MLLAIKDFGKKVIKGKEYKLIYEKVDQYRIIDEDGNALMYPKSIFTIVPVEPVEVEEEEDEENEY